MTERKTFLLGVGAQKSGTSWLYSYLVSSPNVARTPIKEYHVWDALYIPCCKNFSLREKDLKSPAEKMRHTLQETPELYFTHFRQLLDRTSKNVTCDITPSYAGLKKDVFKYIRARFAEQRLSTKAIFLMRDPVERCWSASRMRLRDTVGHTDVSSENLLSVMNSDRYEMRTRYDITIEELEASFEPHYLFIGFYEKLRDFDQLQSMSNFCEVEFRPELANLTVNVSPKLSPLDIDVARQIAKHYKTVYEFVARRMPEVETLWGGYRYL